MRVYAYGYVRVEYPDVPADQQRKRRLAEIQSLATLLGAEIPITLPDGQTATLVLTEGDDETWDIPDLEEQP